MTKKKVATPITTTAKSRTAEAWDKIIGKNMKLEAQLEDLRHPSIESITAPFSTGAIIKLRQMTESGYAHTSGDMMTCLTLTEILLDWQYDQQKSKKSYRKEFAIREAFLQEVVNILALPVPVEVK
jgi:hypothetical protein